jgi:peptidoglycan-N-acetylglucosamine deacetylase
MSYPPEGYTAAGIVDAIIEALGRNGIRGVYAFANSWALSKHPELSRILDRWAGAGHHIANHTHSHIELNDVGAAGYIEDIDLGETHLEPWLSKTPSKYFRHPLCYWGNTEEKRHPVKSHLAEHGYVTADVTSWLYEWRWNRAYRNCLDANDSEGVAFLKRSFLDFAVAQLRYDAQSSNAWFGYEVTGITLGHTVPFFADIAGELFSRLIGEGVEFVSLEEATADPAYGAVASVASGEFLVYQQKLASAAGKPMPMVAPDFQDMFEQVTEMGKGQTG